MGVRLCCLSFLAAAAVTAGDLNVLTGIRNNTPWGQFIIEASHAASDGQYAQAAVAYEKAVRVISGAGRDDRLEFAVAANGLGTSYVKLGRYGEAEPLLNKALATWRELLGPNDVVVAIGLNNVADIYAAYGRYEDARRSRVRALKIDQAALGPASPLVANDWNNLGVVYAQQHKLSAAADALNKAIEIGSSFTPPHPRLAEFMGNLAALMTISNHADEGERLHARVLSMQLRERGRNQPSVGFTLTHIAECEIKLKKYTSAAGHAIEAVGILKARLGDHHTRVASAYFALATAYEKLKRADLAEPALQNMMEIDTQATLEPTVRSSHLREYALVLREQGKKDEAKAMDDMATEVEQQDPEHVLSHGIVDIKELAR